MHGAMSIRQKGYIMEMLNYSLWFTFIWWALVGGVVIDRAKQEIDTKAKAIVLVCLYPSAMSILLEYLIVR